MIRLINILSSTIETLNRFDRMVFNVTNFTKDNIQITVFDIPTITEELKQFMDQHIYKICHGEDGNIETVKKELKSRITGWSESNKIGAIAEFFVHLYLKYCGYQQACLFFNLEEGSLKKGFDGVYSKEEELWFMESKSGLITTRGITHVSKIHEAYLDVKKKITTNVSNNPWLNAYNHARIVGTQQNLRASLKRLSDDFTNHQYQGIDDKNIIPSATIFLNGIWSSQDHNAIIQSIKKMSILEGKNLHVICITQNSYDMFLKYLGD